MTQPQKKLDTAKLSWPLRDSVIVTACRTGVQFPRLLEPHNWFYKVLDRSLRQALEETTA